MINLDSLSDNGLVDWARNFSDKVKVYASDVGLTGADVHRIDEDTNTTSTIVDTSNKAKETRADPALQDELAGYKNTVFHGASEQLRKAFPSVFAGLGTFAAVGILPRLLSFVDSIRKNPRMTGDMAKSLGLDNLAVDKLKGNENELLAWFGNFMNQLKLHQTELDVHDSQVQAANNDYSALEHVVQQTNQAQSAAPNNPQLPNLLNYKDLIKNGPSEMLTRAFPAIAPALLAAVPGILPRFTDYVQKIMHSGGYNEQIGKSLGVAEEKREPVGAPKIAPLPAVPAAAARAGGGFPGWLLPLILLALLGFLTYAMGPKKTRLERGVPGVAPAPVPVTQPATAEPLTISNLKATPIAGGTLITWDTNRPATGQLEFGRTTKLELGISPKTVSLDPHNLVKSHSLKMMDLRHGTDYYYRAISRDKDGNQAMSKETSFHMR